MADRVSTPFLLGIYGLEASEETLRLFRELGPAGVYLLRRNIETTEQVRSLVDGLEQQLGQRLLVAVEHEGGVVSRFTRGVTFFPGNLALGKAGTPALAYQVGKAMARELRAMNINVNLAPVLDVEPLEHNPDLLLRAFGDDPAVASAMGVEMIRGLQEGGVSAGARHFPGRGSAAGEPRQVPVVSLSREELIHRDAAPFRVAGAAGVDIIMTAHAVFSALDPEQPATFSAKIVTDLLRREFGFHGVAMTEDLTSPAVTGSVSVEEAVVRSLQAGNDLILLAHDPDLQRRAFRGFKLAVEGARLPRETLDKAQNRVKDLLKRKEARPPAGTDGLDVAAAVALADSVASAATKIEADPQKVLPIDRKVKAGILFPRLADVAHRVAIDDELRGGAGLIQNWVQEQAATVDVLEIPIQPDADMVDLTLDWAGALDLVVFFCFDAQRYPGQRKLLEELQQRCKKVVAVLIRNPHDWAFIRENTAVVNPCGFRVPQIHATLRALFKK